jgi:tripartite ATP-independent transporter DctP family solute receptor
MKRKRCLWVLLMVTFVGLFLFNNQAVHAAKVMVKAATAMPDTHPNALSIKYMGERANDISGGLLEMEVFTSGSVGGEEEIVESVSLGNIQIYAGAAAILVNYVPELKFLDLPYLFKSRDHVDRVLWGPVGDEITAMVLKKGFRIFGWADSGFQGLYNNVRPVQSLADMKGLKMRVMKNPIRIKAMNSYGASAVPLAWPETYGAMQTKVVNGCENSYETYRSGAHYEVAKFYTESDHAFLPAVVIANEKFYQSLNPRLKAIVRHLAGLCALRYRQLFEEKDTAAKKIVQEKGAVLNVLPDAARRDFRKAVQPMYDDYIKEFGPTLINKIRAAE